MHHAAIESSASPDQMVQSPSCGSGGKLRSEYEAMIHGLLRVGYDLVWVSMMEARLTAGDRPA